MAESMTLTGERGPGCARLTAHVVSGVHRVEHAFANCYLLVEGASWALVAAAFPRTWEALIGAAHELGAATADSAQALASLDVIAARDARVLLPGRGEPWLDGAEAPVASARAIGRSDAGPWVT